MCEIYAKSIIDVMLSCSIICSRTNAPSKLNISSFVPPILINDVTLLKKQSNIQLFYGSILINWAMKRWPARSCFSTYNVIRIIIFCSFFSVVSSLVHCNIVLCLYHMAYTLCGSPFF